MKKTKNYVNNEDLYKAMVEHRAKLDAALAAGKRKPEASRYIGECIMLICENLKKSYRFRLYSGPFDLVGDGIEDCVAAIDNFDPTRFDKPHAYFSMIAYNAFIRKIQKEKKQSYIKHKNFEMSFMNELGDELSSGSANVINEFSADIIKEFEDKLARDKEPKPIDLTKQSKKGMMWRVKNRKNSNKTPVSFENKGEINE